MIAKILAHLNENRSNRGVAAAERLGYRLDAMTKNFLHLRSATLLAAVLAAVAAGVPHGKAFAAASACALDAAPGVTERQLVSKGSQRMYRLFVPAGYDGRARLPLVLDMHGSGGTAERHAATSKFEALAARAGALVATLQAAGPGNRWNVPVTSNRPDDVQYVADVIDDIASRVCLDAARVYATGFSGGARMASLLACRLDTRVAAIAAMAGLRWPGACEGRPVPVLAFHGLVDQVNPYEGTTDGRNGEWLEGVPAALAGWARHNGCRTEAQFEDPPGPLSSLAYAGCREGVAVRLIRIDGLDHRWVREPVDATAEMWRFFSAYSIPFAGAASVR